MQGGYYDVQFAQIDGSVYRNIVKYEGIRGFPTIRLYREGKMTQVLFEMHSMCVYQYEAIRSFCTIRLYRDGKMDKVNALYVYILV